MKISLVTARTTGAALAAALLLALPSVAAAADRQPLPRPAETCPFFFLCAQPPLSPVERWQLYRESGAFGRQGLGASPFRPEGPGNRSF